MSVNGDDASMYQLINNDRERERHQLIKERFKNYIHKDEENVDGYDEKGENENGNEEELIGDNDDDEEEENK